jgi:hypothetical protein
MSSSYLNFVQIVKTLTASTDSNEMDPQAKMLLDEIALQHLNEQPLTVGDLMKLNHIASPATIHRKLDLLLNQQWVALTFAGENRRTKYIVPTKKAQAYFVKLSKALDKAVKSVNG